MNHCRFFLSFSHSLPPPPNITPNLTIWPPKLQRHSSSASSSPLPNKSSPSSAHPQTVQSSATKYFAGKHLLFAFPCPVSAQHLFFYLPPFLSLNQLPTLQHFFNNRPNRYQENGYPSVTPVNPKEPTIESLACVPSLSSLPGTPSDYHVSIITPPTVTKSILEEAHKNGICRVWLQPGVESDAALEFAKEKGMQVIAGGPCVLENGIPAKQL